MSETDTRDNIEKRILDAAGDLFAHFGYDKTTMNDIAQEAGVAKSTIYIRWKKKQDIFEALLLRESKAVTYEWFARVEADPRGGSVGAWLRHALAATFENQLLFVMYKQDRRILGKMIQHLGQGDLFVRRQQVFLQLYRELQAVGAVRKDVDLPSVVYLVNAIQYGLIHFDDVVPDEHTPPLENVWETLIEMLDKHLTPADGGNAEAGKVVIERFMEHVRRMLAEYETQLSNEK